MQNFKPRPTGKSPTLSDLEGCLSERASLSSSSRFPLSAFAWVLGLAWPDRRKWGVVCTLIYSHSWAGHISMFCSGSWAGGAFLHFVIGQCSTLWPRQYISLCRRTESSYILNICQPGIFFFTDKHEHLNVLIIFLSAQVTFTPASLSDEKVHWKQDKEQFSSNWKVCEGCHFWQKS